MTSERQVSSVNDVKEPFLGKKLSSHSYSFIQNILYEDSCTGVTIIDLFIALKSIKENLELLTESNEKISERVNFINEEAETVWKEFIELLESMRIFLEKMNADASIYDLEKLSNKSATNNSYLRRSNGNIENSDFKSKRTCKECGSDVTETYLDKNKKFTCLGCLISAFTEKSLSQLPISCEAFLGSFLASILYWQRGHETGGEPIFSETSSLKLENTSSSKNLNLRESTMQMISDICKVLNLSGVREREKGPPRGTDPVSFGSKAPEEEGAKPSGSEYKETYLSSKEELETKDELTSEGESEFEEALTCQSDHPHDSNEKSIMTCMGDLSKAQCGNQSVTTLAACPPSWAGRLSPEIKYKVKQRKSKRHKKTNVKVFEQRFEKSEMELSKTPETLQFSIAANPSAGVFDVTVVQYKNNRHLSKYPIDCKKKVHPELVSNSLMDSHFPILLKSSQDRFLSDESIPGSESESMKTCSNFGDENLGDFAELYAKYKISGNEAPLPVLSSKNHLYGDLRTMELKTGKTHFIEMYRLYPVFFMQEYVKKTSRPQRNRKSERENHNNASQEKIFSLNSAEQEEEQIVIERSSSDLVIYIQLELEDESGTVSNCQLYNFEKSSIENRTNENNSGSRLLSSERTIRLGNDVQRGESLFRVWRAQEANRWTEAKDTERVIHKKPLLMIEKPEEETDKNQAEVIYNMSDTSIEREIESRFPREEKVMGRADVLVIKNIKQSASIWYNQIAKRRKSAFIRLRKVKAAKVPKEIIDSVNLSAGELRKALLLIREFENNLVETEVDNAVTVLPRLELELRRHLHTKLKGLGITETKNSTSVDNFFSSFDFEQHDDSIGGDSDESSEFRFNNLIKLLSNLEEAVKTSEHSKKKIELFQYDSSKIYQLLHGLTDSIRELEEGLSIKSLSKTLNYASRLHTAVKEYDSIVKKQPADYLVPQLKNKKKRKPKWSKAEETSVARHLKNVRKKVFQMIEMEAVEMEERIERDFDRLDRLGTENNEALMFLETLLQKTQKRLSEFQSLKSELKDLHALLNGLNENLQKEDKKETRIERSIEKTCEENSDGNSQKEEVKEKSSEKISGETSNRSSEKNLEMFFERNFERMLEKNEEKNLQRTSKNNINEVPSIRRGSVFEKNSNKSSGTISKKTSSSVSESHLETTTKEALPKFPDKVSEISFKNSVEGIIEKNSGRSSIVTSKRTSNRDQEKIAEKNSRKTSRKISDKTLQQCQGKSREKIVDTNLKRDMEKSFKKSLEKIPSRVLEEDQKKTPAKIPKKSSERNDKKFLERTSGGSLERTSRTLTKNSEEFFQNTLNQISEIILEEKEEEDRKEEKQEQEKQEKQEEREEEKEKKGQQEQKKREAGPKNTQVETISQESLEQIVSSFINAIDYLKLRTTQNKNEDKNLPLSQAFEKAQQLMKSTPGSWAPSAPSAPSAPLAPSTPSDTSEPSEPSNSLFSAIKELKVIGQNSLYLSWTEPEGCLEGSIHGYEIYVDGKLNQKVRNPQRLQAVLYSVDLSKKIQVKLYAVVENNHKTLLASMDLNGPEKFYDESIVRVDKQFTVLLH